MDVRHHFGYIEKFFKKPTLLLIPKNGIETQKPKGPLFA
jgi:hypothetical protein